VRVLGHLSALIGVKEDVVNIERGSNKGLLVSGAYGHSSRSGTKGGHSPEALTNRSEVKVDLHLVVLKGDKRKGKSRVSAEPELKRHIESGLRKGVSRGAHLGRGTGSSARTSNTGESGVGHVCELGGVSNKLEISTLLLSRHGELVPDVHPVTILAVDSLTSNLNLDLGDELLTNIV
jgi:hypothetical protein